MSILSNVPTPIGIINCTENRSVCISDLNHISGSIVDLLRRIAKDVDRFYNLTICIVFCGRYIPFRINFLDCLSSIIINSFCLNFFGTSISRPSIGAVSHISRGVITEVTGNSVFVGHRRGISSTISKGSNDFPRSISHGSRVPFGIITLTGRISKCIGSRE